MIEGCCFKWLFDRKIINEHRSSVVISDTSGTAPVPRHFASAGHTVKWLFLVRVSDTKV